MDRAGLLLLSGSIRLVLESLSNYLKTCNEKVVKRLYIKLEPDLNNPLTKSEVSYLKNVSDFIPLVYDKAFHACQSLDVRVMLSNHNIDGKVALSTKYDVVFTNSVEKYGNISSYIHNYLKGSFDSLVNLPKNSSPISEHPEDQPSSKEFDIYRTVCLGGTFDRLHNGHKVLLSEAALRATQKLIVGVTDGSMLKKKSLWELIEPVEKRISDVTEFLNDVDPTLHYEVVPITDPYGPTITDPDIDCIVVSAETKVGGERVNLERKKRGMSELSMHVVNLVENTEDVPGEEKKLSSSNVRMRLLGTCLKPPQKSSNDIYAVCLQGCPYTGKSCIAHYFNKGGGAIINSKDIIQSILREDVSKKDFMSGFNENILKEGSIDYEKLIHVCLLDEEKRRWTAEYLNQKVEEEIKKTIQILQTEGKKHVLVQGSLLTKLKLGSQVNETWSTILPASEVETRLSKAYDLSAEDAEKVVSMLPSNAEYVKQSNRVFCTKWSDDITEQQVLKAWSDLRVLSCSKI